MNFENRSFKLLFKCEVKFIWNLIKCNIDTNIVFTQTNWVGLSFLINQIMKHVAYVDLKLFCFACIQLDFVNNQFHSLIFLALCFISIFSTVLLLKYQAKFCQLTTSFLVQKVMEPSQLVSVLLIRQWFYPRYCIHSSLSLTRFLKK